MAQQDPDFAASVDAEYDGLLARLRARSARDLLFGGPYDERDALLTISAGAGGTEATDWAEMLLRMYLRWAERHRFATEIVDQLEGEQAGLKSVTVGVHGRMAYGWLRAERGVHRLVRISPFDAQKRRQTTFALHRGACPRWRTTPRSSSTGTRSGSTPTAPRAPAASTSTRPTRRSA